MNNVYYDPEKFGLIIVGELEYSTGSYEFDTRVVWLQAESNKLFTARDSGCSCPTPFEDFGLNDLSDITKEFEPFLTSEYKEERENGQVIVEEVEMLINKCKVALGGDSNE